MEKLVVANWKSHKSISDATNWVKTIRLVLEESLFKVVVCPDFVSIPIVRSLLKGSSVCVGSQDISAHEPGSFTGEVSAHSLKGLVDYSIIGHSERRKIFEETTDQVVQKVDRTLEVGIIPIVCFGNTQEAQEYKKVGGKVEGIYFAYEPQEAIGSGEPENPANASKFHQQVNELFSSKVDLLYGGSVDSESVSDYLEVGFAGTLIGTASLDEGEFAKIIRMLNKLNPTI